MHVYSKNLSLLVRSHCSAIMKQPCLNKAKKGKDQREHINSENDFYKHFQACKQLYCRETWKEKNVIINGFPSILKKQIEM